MKDRPLWSRVSRCLWRSTDFRKMGPMPPSTPGLWIYLLTGEHCKSVPGLFVLGVGTIRDDLGWPEAAIKKHLAALVELGHVKVDPVTRVMWLPNALGHNFPDNPNMVAGWKRDWHAIPDCDLKTEAQASLRKQLAEVPPKVQKDSAGNVVPPASMTPYADSFDIAIGVRQPNPSPNPSGKPKGNTNPKEGGHVGGNVTPRVRSDLTPNVDQTEEREKERDGLRPPRGDASAQAPAREDAAPKARTDEDGKSQPENSEATPADPASEAPRKFPRPYVVPTPGGHEDLSILRVIAEASRGKFDELTGGTMKRRAVAARLRALGVTAEIGDEMGVLLWDAHALWPKATGLDPSGVVSMSYLLGKADDEGEYGGEWLGSLVGKAKASLARKAQEALDAEARRSAPRPAPTPELSAAAKAAAMERIRARRAEAPGPVSALPSTAPAEVTHG